MGQTLSHGVYLPAEGERNCYSGLASNWNLLDTALGDIDGKASATHTHGNITNDGKLATANRVLITDGNKVISLSGVTDTELGYLSGVTSNVQTQLDSKAGLTADNIFSGDNSFHNVTPGANKSYDLGSSSYQWNNLYAKNYYYNGTAWGLDQANVWTGENIFNYDLLIKNANATQGTAPSSNKTWTLTFCDSNKATTGQLYCQYRTNGSIYLPLRINNGTYDYRLNFILDAAGYAGFNPSVSGIINLGSSNYKWKTLNGINPGALSLPDDSSSVSIDTTNWNVSGGFGNGYTPASDGWLHINIKDTATNSIFVFATNKYSASVYGNGSQGLAGRLALMIPVLSGVTYAIIITAGSVSEIYTVKFFPCKGNV